MRDDSDHARAERFRQGPDDRADHLCHRREGSGCVAHGAAFARAGHRVHLGDSLRHPLAAASRLHQGYHRLPPFRFDLAEAAAALAERLSAEKVDLLVPTCEEVLYLGQIWRDRDMPARLFAPGFDLLEEVHNKHRFILLCAKLGLPVPRTRLLTTPDEVQALLPVPSDLVLKPVWSRFATQTAIRPGLQRLARIRPSLAFPWVAQEFVAGEEVSVYAIAHAGRITAFSAYIGLIRAGVGASVCFEPVRDGGAEDFARRFVEGTGWTGQISFDLIRRPDGTVLPLECNPRATSGLHFFRDPAALSRALLGEGSADPDVTRPQGVRLALWLYGGAQVLKPGGWRRFGRAVTEVQDVMDWPGDRLGVVSQLRPFAELSRLAMRHGISLQAASTRDIEWDGPDQSSST